MSGPIAGDEWSNDLRALLPIHSVPPTLSMPQGGYVWRRGAAQHQPEKFPSPARNEERLERQSGHSKGGSQGPRVLSGETTQDSAPGEGRDLGNLSVYSPLTSLTRNTAGERQGDRCKQLHARPCNPSRTPRTASIMVGELNPSSASATEKTH